MLKIPIMDKNQHNQRDFWYNHLLSLDLFCIRSEVSSAKRKPSDFQQLAILTFYHFTRRPRQNFWNLHTLRVFTMAYFLALNKVIRNKIIYIYIYI